MKRAAPFVLCFAAAVFFGLAVKSPLPLSTVWPSNAILISGLLLLDKSSRRFCLALCALASLSAGAAIADSALRAVTFSSLNLFECLAVAFLTRRACGRNPDFTNGLRLFSFLAGAVLPGCLMGAVLLQAVLPTLHFPPGAVNPLRWCMGHVLGAAVVVPSVTAIAGRRRFAALSRPPMELAAAMLALTAFAIALFWQQAHISVLFLLFPAMMLVAFRYGPVGAALGSLAVGGVSGLFLHLGLSHLALGGVEQSASAKVQWLQFFVASIVLTTLPASGAVASYARLRTLLARRTAIARDARGRADAAAAAKGEFLANMSHEIRTPLNGVIGLADALSRTELTDQQREMLKMILSSGKALTGLLSDALDLARADSGALKLVDEPFDVRETIGAAAYLFETLAHEKGLAFRVAFDLDAPGAAVGDALRIRQVVSNLISNAVKFTAEGGVSLQVSLKREADGVGRLTAVVRDTGPGFDETVRARLFNRFEQGDSSVTRRYGGSGLGLSIAHRLSEMMRGRIDCESEPGRGSVFTFSARLPMSEAVQQAQSPSDHAAEAPARRLSVLLAEDHPVNRKVIQAMVGDTVALTMAVDGREAVEAFRAQVFDAVLMDTHMPVMDGLSATRAIRALEAEAGRTRTPIVSLTADAMPQQVEAARAAGADLHLAKPITGEGLFSALQACLRLRDRAQGLKAAS